MKKVVVVVCALAFVAVFVSVASAAPKHAWKPAKVQFEAAKKIGQPAVITNSIGMKFVLIPAGSFMMGSPPNELRRYGDEGPQHRVVISRPFYLQTTEVTQAQYREIMGKNQSRFKGCNRCPVEMVSGHDAQEFIRRLNKREGTNKYRLPTEAEWEYACRAGSKTAYSFGDDRKRLGEYAWYSDNSGKKTHPVGQKKPNAWGLNDMHGNVRELCSDWYGRDYYRRSPSRDPKGPSAGGSLVLRGGSWNDIPAEVRSANRGRNYPAFRHSYHGLRVVVIY